MSSSALGLVLLLRSCVQYCQTGLHLQSFLLAAHALGDLTTSQVMSQADRACPSCHQSCLLPCSQGSSDTYLMGLAMTTRGTTTVSCQQSVVGFLALLISQDPARGMGQKGETWREMGMEPACGDWPAPSWLVWSKWGRRTSAKGQGGHLGEAWPCF